MDGARFDGVARRWSSQSRRGALGLLAGGLAALALDGGATDARHKKRCKHGATKCQGRCIPPGQLCCPRGQEDSGGVCAVRPTCRGFQQSCSSDTDCCSGTCAQVDSPVCTPSNSGDPCLDNDDCKHSAPCTGFICGD
ncbi:MAG TPA: hypothetical protein VFU81_02520 [Thermomicrobiales bacterium]|nr:hypothetical protein [Thermomicrobiales bacterium]